MQLPQFPILLLLPACLTSAAPGKLHRQGRCIFHAERSKCKM